MSKNSRLVEAITETLYSCLVSPNVSDSNGEAANLVDTTNNIAKALWKLAEAVEKLANK